MLLTFKIKKEEKKLVPCPCCGKKATYLEEKKEPHPLDLINDIENFFNLVRMCPVCGYAELYDTGISEEIKDFVKTEDYRNVFLMNNLDIGYKKWVLYAFIAEFDESYLEAGIAYLKAYDYLEYKGYTKDPRMIRQATSCFLKSAEETEELCDVYLAIDCLRRVGDIKEAEELLDTVKKVFPKEAEKILWKEETWIMLKSTDKYYLHLDLKI